jgi:c-di-GMP-binding flagellar brake protein YcgR
MINKSVVQDCLPIRPLERRSFPRVPIAVQAELTVVGNSAPIRLATSDLSAGGCYVQMALTLEVATRLKVVLWLGQKKLSLEGKVVTRHPQFGNGIEFTGVSCSTRAHLQRFLDQIVSTSGSSRVVKPI